MSSIEVKANYGIRRLAKENLADVERLHNIVYGRIPAENFFHNKYNTAFTGVNHVGFIAYDGRGPVAFYAVVPCFLTISGEEILSAQSADTMTHPQYRNRGLFIELATLTYQLCINEGIKLLFGFPNQNSFPGFINKLGWQTTETMDCFILPVSRYSWQRVFRKMKFLRPAYQLYQRKVLSSYVIPLMGVKNSVFHDGCNGIKRDEAYLNYKTYAAKQVMKISNSLVWLKINNELLIGDIDIGPGDFKLLVPHLKRLAYKLGIGEIYFHACNGTALHTLFSGWCKVVPSFPVIYKQLGRDVAIDRIKFTSADIDTF